MSLTEALEAIAKGEKDVAATLKELNEELVKVGMGADQLTKAEQSQVDALDNAITIAFNNKQNALLTQQDTKASAHSSTVVQDLAVAVGKKDALLSESLLNELLNKAQSNVAEATNVFKEDFTEIATAVKVYKISKAELGEYASADVYKTVDDATNFVDNAEFKITLKDAWAVGDTVTLKINGTNVTLKATTTNVALDGWSGQPAGFTVTGDATAITIKGPANQNFQVTDVVAAAAGNGDIADTAPAFTKYAQPADLDNDFYGYVADGDKAGGTPVAGNVTAKSDTLTLKEVQDAIATLTTVRDNHVTAMGTNEKILLDLQAKLAGYANVSNANFEIKNVGNNVDVSIDTVGKLVAAIDDALVAVGEKNAADTTVTDIIRKGAIDDLVGLLKSAGDTLVVLNKVSGGAVATDADTAASAVNSYLADIADLINNATEVTAAENAFALITIGSAFNEIKGIVDARNKLVNEVENNAQIKGELDALKQALVDAMTELEQAKEALGFDLTHEFDGGTPMGVNGKVDLFLFDKDSTAAPTYTINALEKGDALFLNGWTFNDGAVKDKADNGDNSVLEFWIDTVGSVTTITYETAVYGSAQPADAGVAKIILSGVAEVTEDGLIVIA